ncbi:MAG: YjbH domain-containing protein [Parachlamydia sp.]|nr:YjbH domain-containing protein [Parachlamydia sp.]
MFILFVALLIFLPGQVYSQDLQDDLMRDLMIVDYWNRKLAERLPVTYNHLLQGGYLNMPSARMGGDGELGVGYAWNNPYINYNLRVQLAKRLEVTGNYRILKGVEDPILSRHGFGDFSDKGASIKFALFLPEDSDYVLPGIALGCDDIIGTRNFRAQYIVLTQVFLDYDFEVSVGYGEQRIHEWFGGISWFPFRKSCSPYLQGLSFVSEYDAIPDRADHELKRRLHHHEHKKRKGEKRGHINVGFKYRLFNYFDFSLSYMRGHSLACSFSTFYNFGCTEGFVPKIEDPLPYQAPVNTEPIGWRRPEDVLAQDLLYAFREQGFDILDVWLSYIDGCKVLRLKVFNDLYFWECDVREQLNHLIAALIPSDIDQVIVTMDDEGVPVDEYRFDMQLVSRYKAGEICLYEFNLLNPLHEVSYVDPCVTSLLFHQERERWNIEIYPKTSTFFGGSTGKFKYALGLHFGLNGFIFRDVYYSVLLGWIFLSDLKNLSGIDRLNPSQIVNVRSDIVEYAKQKGITVDEAYLQKNWNVGCGCFFRLAGGLFEEEYGGLATEFLCYPVNSCWAIGVEGAQLFKRKHSGLGFTNKVRKLEGFRPTHRHFHFGQYFLDLYYKWHASEIDLKVQIGKFLANDYGMRLELTRYFPSGLRVGIWQTWTNGHDRINGKLYFDKGIFFSMPLDIFYTHSDRSRFHYGLSAWLRDVGAISATGKGLYDIVNDMRQ